jgi:hypothetical protein
MGCALAQPGPSPSSSPHLVCCMLDEVHALLWREAADHCDDHLVLPLADVAALANLLTSPEANVVGGAGGGQGRGAGGGGGGG